jgi:L-aspartate oxidase
VQRRTRGQPSLGVRAGRDIVKRERKLSDGLAGTIPDWVYPKNELEFDPMLIQSDMFSLQSTMWNYVGIVRTRERLTRAISDLNYLEHRVQQFYRSARVSREILALRNAIITGNLVAQAANKNTQSLGCHFVQDAQIS